MRTALLTGFAPFDGESTNPSWLAVRALNGHILQVGSTRVQIHSLELATEFSRGSVELLDALARLRPQICICVGQAGGRDRLSLEKVALNFIDARIPDNAGFQPIDTPVLSSKMPGHPEPPPNAYFAAFPLQAALARLQQAQIPAELSLTAGSYVCNAVYYHLLHAHAAQATQAANEPNQQGLQQALFLHIPYAPHQILDRTGVPSMPISVVQQALQILLEVALGEVSDRAEPAGASV